MELKMQVCIVYAAKSRESGDKLKTICQSLAKGLEMQGHQADVVNAHDDTRLTLYDYVVIGSESVSFFSASVPEILTKFLAEAGTVSGKRCMAFITPCLRKGKTLQNLMKTMEREGMMLKISEVIKKPEEALAIGKRLNVERNN